MKVILLKNVDKLGRAGEAAEVKDGYARNFLIPQKLAQPATAAALAQAEKKKQEVEAQAEKELFSAESAAEKLQSMALNIKAKANEEGKLFAAITPQKIVEELKKKGVNVHKDKILIALIRNS